MPAARKFVGAVAQIAQEFFDTPANLGKAIEAIESAARDGADIVVFPECFLGQFPYWAQYYQSPADHFDEVASALFDGAVMVGGDECRRIAEACRRARVHVVMGCNELSDEPGSATLYNTFLFFDRDGDLMGRHRKLLPTYAERLVHGRGDGRGLRVYETDLGRLGGLICWEHHMTLAKATMTALGEEIHVAGWPGMWRKGGAGERIIEPDFGGPFTCDMEFAIREYAAETGNFVLSASGYLPAQNISDRWRELIPSLQADWAIGGSAIVAPGGAYLVEPVIDEERILLAEIDLNARRLWKAWFDPMGHYSRPDVFSLVLHDPDGRDVVQAPAVEVRAERAAPVVEVRAERAAPVVEVRAERASKPLSGHEDGVHEPVG